MFASLRMDVKSRSHKTDKCESDFFISRACFYESRATYPVTIVCACLLVDSSCEKYTTGGARIFNKTI